MARHGIFMVAAVVMIAITAVSPASILFEDSKSHSGSEDYNTDSRALNETPTGQHSADEDTRFHHNHNRRKNKRVICGLAHLIAKRETDAGLRTRRQTTEQGRGLGVAGFLLGAFVGSKYQQHQYQYQTQQHPPPHQQQQQQGQGQQQQQQGISNEDYDQVDDQSGGGPSNNGGGGGHGGGGGLCNSLQQHNVQQYIGGIGSGSHPILASLLINGGGGGAGPNKIGQLPQSQSSGQSPQFQRPGPIQFSQFQRPAPVNELQRPAPVQIRPQPIPQRPTVQQQSGFINTYVRPWVDLFL